MIARVFISITIHPMYNSSNVSIVFSVLIQLTGNLGQLALSKTRNSVKPAKLTIASRFQKAGNFTGCTRSRAVMTSPLGTLVQDEWRFREKVGICQLTWYFINLVNHRITWLSENLDVHWDLFVCTNFNFCMILRFICYCKGVSCCS